MPPDIISESELYDSLANLPRWKILLQNESERWSQAKATARAGGRRILIASGVGGGASSALAAFESLLAVALTLRGADVTILLCDQDLPACMNLEKLTFPDAGALAAGKFQGSYECRTCAATGRAIFEPLGLTVKKFRDFLDWRDKLGQAMRKNLLPEGRVASFHGNREAIVEHGTAGALRYFARGDLQNEEMGLQVADRFQEAAILTDSVMKRCIAQLKPEACVSSHGLYVPYGAIGAACRKAGVRYAAWNVAYRKQCFIFSHGETYHHTLLSESQELWETMPWTPWHRDRIEKYLESRVTGTHDWIWFFENPNNDVAQIYAHLGVDPSRPVILALTNVVWDAQLHYRANAYPTMLEWLIDTVDWFATRPGLQLIIRIHPAEVRPTLPSRQRAWDELKRLRPQLPPNVFVIGPEQQISTYALADRADTAIIYGTKTGVELACMGIPVIVAGEAWVRGKGVTQDAESRASYHQLLETLPKRQRLPEEVRERAYRYAYHFFFRRMIPIRAAKMVPNGWPPFQVVPSTLEELSPGRDPGLDTICAGLLEGREFVFDELNIGAHAG